MADGGKVMTQGQPQQDSQAVLDQCHRVNQLLTPLSMRVSDDDILGLLGQALVHLPMLILILSISDGAATAMSCIVLDQQS